MSDMRYEESVIRWDFDWTSVGLSSDFDRTFTGLRMDFRVVGFRTGKVMFNAA